VSTLVLRLVIAGLVALVIVWVLLDAPGVVLP
jgi:hypothetical protein